MNIDGVAYRTIWLACVDWGAALPALTIDWTLANGGTIPIEGRAAEQVTHITGLGDDGASARVRITPQASRDGLLSLYPEQTGAAA